MSKLINKEQEVIDKYNSGLSLYQLENIYNVSRETLRKILIKYNIRRRNVSENNIARLTNYFRLSNSIIDMMQGWLLGDGSIHFTGNQAYFCMTSKHKEYIEHIYKIMKKDGLICRINKVVNRGFIAYKIFTPSTLQFAELYKIWYKDNRKIVPKTLVLSNNSIKYWIMDDGTVDKKNGHLRFCTCAFSIDECEYLSRELNYLLNSSKASWVVEKKKYPRIYLPRKFAGKLFSMIGKCDVGCFDYKWQNNLNHPGGVLFYA